MLYFARCSSIDAAAAAAAAAETRSTFCPMMVHVIEYLTLSPLSSELPAEDIDVISRIMMSQIFDRMVMYFSLMLCVDVTHGECFVMLARCARAVFECVNYRRGIAHRS